MSDELTCEVYEDDGRCDAPAELCSRQGYSFQVALCKDHKWISERPRWKLHGRQR